MTSLATAAAIGAVASYASSKSAGNAADKAAGIQGDANRQALYAQQDNLDKARQILAPYVNLGNQSIDAQGDLLGFNGGVKQQAAYDNIIKSPAFTTTAKQGENALLANASATGGLRGGNLEAGLAQFRPQLLSQMIQQQYGNLGNLSTLGEAAASGSVAAGTNSTNSISNLLGEGGAIGAGSALANGAAKANMWNGVGNGAGLAAAIYSRNRGQNGSVNYTSPNSDALPDNVANQLF